MRKPTLLTTTIGSFPKPTYVPIINWFQSGMSFRTPKESPKAPEDLFIRGTKEVVLEQVRAGIDIPTDGEVRRENYIYYHCRHLSGIDF